MRGGSGSSCGGERLASGVSGTVESGEEEE